MVDRSASSDDHLSKCRIQYTQSCPINNATLAFFISFRSCPNYSTGILAGILAGTYCSVAGHSSRITPVGSILVLATATVSHAQVLTSSMHAPPSHPTGKSTNLCAPSALHLHDVPVAVVAKQLCVALVPKSPPHFAAPMYENAHTRSSHSVSFSPGIGGSMQRDTDSLRRHGTVSWEVVRVTSVHTAPTISRVREKCIVLEVQRLVARKLWFAFGLEILCHVGAIGCRSYFRREAEPQYLYSLSTSAVLRACHTAFAVVLRS